MLKRKIIFLSIFLKIFFSVAQDIWSPDSPVLDSVSVDISNINGDVYIGWQASDSADVAGYYIYTDSSIGSNIIWLLKDTVLGQNNTLYIDNNSLASYQSVGYRVAAFDNSNNISLMTEPHFTIYVFPYLEDQNCTKIVRLVWQYYIGWQEVVRYEIYRKKDTEQNFTYIGDVPGNIREYVDENLQDNTNYCYYVKAISSDGFSSSSNRPCILVDIPNLPEYVEIANVSTIEENKIQITVLADETTDGSNSLLLYRKKVGEDDSNYKQIAKTTLKNGVKEYNFIDNSADNINYIYKVAVINLCGNTILESEEAGNIVIKLSLIDNLKYFLEWNAYSWWEGGIDSTFLYRQIDNYRVEVIKEEDIIFNDYFDNLTQYNFRSKFYEGNFCYYVRFKQKEQSPDSEKIYYSQSNKICFTEFSRVFLPNAFFPYWAKDSINSIFKPSALFIKKQGYYFAIYDRWGNRIFETTNPQRGWDGSLPNGEKAPMGYYTYYLIYVDNKNEIHKRSGKFIAIE